MPSGVSHAPVVPSGALAPRVSPRCAPPSATVGEVGDHRCTPSRRGRAQDGERVAAGVDVPSTPLELAPCRRARRARAGRAQRRGGRLGLLGVDVSDEQRQATGVPPRWPRTPSGVAGDARLDARRPGTGWRANAGPRAVRGQRARASPGRRPGAGRRRARRTRSRSASNVRGVAHRRGSPPAGCGGRGRALGQRLLVRQRELAHAGDRRAAVRDVVAAPLATVAAIGRRPARRRARRRARRPARSR